MSTTQLLQQITDATLADAIAPGTGLVAVEFTAEWCGPCRMMAPALERIAEEYAGRARVVQMNADENTRTTARYDVRSLPTVLLFRDGAPVDRIVGAVSLGTLRARIDRLAS